MIVVYFCLVINFDVGNKISCCWLFAFDRSVCSCFGWSESFEWMNEWKLYLSSEKSKSAYVQKWKKYKPSIKTDQIRAKIFKN